MIAKIYYRKTTQDWSESPISPSLSHVTIKHCLDLASTLTSLIWFGASGDGICIGRLFWFQHAQRSPWDSWDQTFQVPPQTESFRTLSMDVWFTWNDWWPVWVGASWVLTYLWILHSSTELSCSHLSPIQKQEKQLWVSGEKLTLIWILTRTKSWNG